MTYRRRFRDSLLTGVAGCAMASYALSPLLRGVAVLLLVFSAVQLAFSVRDLRRHRHGRSYLRHAALVYAPHAVVGLLLLGALHLWLVLAPPAPTAISSLPPDRLRARLEADTARLAPLRARVASTLQGLEAAAARRPIEAAALRTAWRACMELTAELDALVQVYQGFAHVDAVAEPDLHAQAFAIGLDAYVQQLVLLCRAKAMLDAAPGARNLLDAPDNRFGAGTCSHTLASLASDTPLLRMHVGAAYLQLIRSGCSPDVPVLPELDRDLDAALTAFNQTTLKAFRNPLRQWRRLGRLREWFPARE